MLERDLYIWMAHDNKFYDPKTHKVNVKIFEEIKTLGKGKSFGELALTNDKPRAARVKCL